MFSDDSLVHLAGIFHNLYLRLEETEHDLYDGDSGWYVYIHHAAERPTLGVRTHGTSLYPGQGRDLRLDMKKVVLYHEFILLLYYRQNRQTFQCKNVHDIVLFTNFPLFLQIKHQLD